MLEGIADETLGCSAPSTQRLICQTGARKMKNNFSVCMCMRPFMLCEQQPMAKLAFINTNGDEMDEICAQGAGGSYHRGIIARQHEDAVSAFSV